MKQFLLISMCAIFVNAGTITVNISGIRHYDGLLRCVLFSNSDGFPSNYVNGIRDTSIKNPPNVESISFFNIPSGTYAVSILHDRNGNTRMDSGMFGMPREPYGVSNNVHPKTRAPRFEECSFLFKDSEKKTIAVALKNP